jgi:hypothetical protein
VFSSVMVGKTDNGLVLVVQIELKVLPSRAPTTRGQARWSPYIKVLPGSTRHTSHESL